MTTVLGLLVVAVVIAGISYFANAGFGDRKPPEAKKKDQDSAGDPDAEAPPPHK